MSSTAPFAQPALTPRRARSLRGLVRALRRRLRGPAGRAGALAQRGRFGRRTELRLQARAPFARHGDARGPGGTRRAIDSVRRCPACTGSWNGPPRPEDLSPRGGRLNIQATDDLDALYGRPPSLNRTLKRRGFAGAARSAAAAATAGRVGLCMCVTATVETLGQRRRRQSWPNARSERVATPSAERPRRQGLAGAHGPLRLRVTAVNRVGTGGAAARLPQAFVRARRGRPASVPARAARLDPQRDHARAHVGGGDYGLYAVFTLMLIDAGSRRPARP